MLASLTARRPGPARWIARWAVAMAICLVPAVDAGAPATHDAPAQRPALVAPASP